MDSRRNFIKKTAILGAGVTFMPSLTFGMDKYNNTEKLKIGLIGVGLRGTNHLDNLLLRNDVVITAICDVDPDRTKLAVDKITQKGNKKPLVFGKDDYDYRNLLALDNVDAVIISTPWLWHTRMA
ncbi:MAG TPA: twin-arginine translocation signal domain-containing protein, partial [Mariniflexile sp.]|nr:twin-arginine translocation signal domain-containing protein [Mariniflexile sp.]